MVLFYEFNVPPFNLTFSLLIEVCEISPRQHNELGLIHNEETPLARHDDAKEKSFSMSSDALRMPNIIKQTIKNIT